MKDNLHISTEPINIPELHESYPHLAPIHPLRFIFEDIEVILGQDNYHVVRPIEFLLGDDSSSPCYLAYR